MPRDDAPPRVWRPRLWIRLLAAAVPLLLASTVLYPGVLNPDWSRDMPSEEMPWMALMVAVTGLVAVATWVSSIRVAPETVRIVNPWGSRRLRRSEIVNVGPGPYGVELHTRQRRHVAFAVQCTDGYVGTRPRWVDVVEAITDREPEWRELDEEAD